MLAKNGRRAELVCAAVAGESDFGSSTRRSPLRKGAGCARFKVGPIGVNPLPASLRGGIVDLIFRGALSARELGGHYANHNCCSEKETGFDAGGRFFAAPRH